jgi:hypothetical protein
MIILIREISDLKLSTLQRIKKSVFIRVFALANPFNLRSI